MQQELNKSVEEIATSKVKALTILIIVVCAAVLIIHWPALSAKALSFDDNRYFVENFLVRSPSLESTRRFLTEVFNPSTVSGYYQPLTMISLMLDYAIGGQTDSLLPFHRTSLLLHIANTALIIVLLYYLFGSEWIAAGVGLLFGVHPLTVEPIPWISERKTLLAAFFAFWSLILYIRSTRSGNSKTRIASIVMYALALVSKPTSTPLPVLMLLMDYWPLRRLKWQTILEKWPFFIIGGISAVITYTSQSRTASVITPEAYGLIRVPLVICHNIIFYLYKMIWPVNLSSHYALPDQIGFSTPMVMAGVIGTCILVVLLLVSWWWTRAAITGFAVFFIAIFPTMQMLQFSDVIASDKFVYLPSIGILMILAVFLVWVCKTGDTSRHTARYIAVAIIVLILATAESFATRKYLACWKDTTSLFTQMVKVAPNATSPRNNLGVALAENGHKKEAVECFTQVLKQKPNDLMANLNMGKILSEEGKNDEAMKQYYKLLRIKPDEVLAYQNIAVTLMNEGHIDEAIAVYRKGLENITRNPALMHVGIGTLLFQQGKIDEAIYELQIAMKIGPNSTALNNLAVALSLKGRTDEAMVCCKRAIGLDPNNPEAHYNLGNILLSQNKLKKAISEYEKAVSIKPKYTKANINLSVALTRENQFDEAIKYAAKAAKTEPNNFDAQYNLAMSLGQRGRIDEAINCFGKTVEIEPNNADAHFGLAQALVYKNRLQEAANEYRQVLNLQPQDIDTRCILGDVLAKQNRFDEAAVEYRQVLKIDPNNSHAQQGLKNIQQK